MWSITRADKHHKTSTDLIFSLVRLAWLNQVSETKSGEEVLLSALVDPAGSIVD